MHLLHFPASCSPSCLTPADQHSACRAAFSLQASFQKDWARSLPVGAMCSRGGRTRRPYVAQDVAQGCSRKRSRTMILLRSLARWRSKHTDIMGSPSRRSRSKVSMVWHAKSWPCAKLPMSMKRMSLVMKEQGTITLQVAQGLAPGKMIVSYVICHG